MWKLTKKIDKENRGKFKYLGGIFLSSVWGKRPLYLKGDTTLKITKDRVKPKREKVAEWKHMFERRKFDEKMI